MNRNNRYIGFLVCALCVNPVQAIDWGGMLQGIVKEKLAPQSGSSSGSNSATTQEKPLSHLFKAAVGGDNISEEEEARIGQQWAGNLLGAAPLVKDDNLQRYVNRVGRWVALQSERADLTWRFGVIDTDDLNAFAAPGGYIFLTKGLYRKLKSEAELAGVLGHEIGHVIKKHHLKVEQKSHLTAALGAYASQKAKGQGSVVQNLIGNGAEAFARGLDKSAEFEADRIGVVLSARAGYDPYALPAVLAEIGHVAQSDKSVSLLFKTHPLPEARLTKLSEAVGDKLDTLPEGQSGAMRFYRLR